LYFDAATLIRLLRLPSHYVTATPDFRYAIDSAADKAADADTLRILLITPLAYFHYDAARLFILCLSP